MVTLFSVRMPDGSELGWLYALRRNEAEAFTAEALSDQYGDGLLLIETKRMTPQEARSDIDRRKDQGLDLWWVGLAW